MNKYELMPTEDNLKKTLFEDKLSRNKYLVYFYKLLSAQNESSTIALDGRWGSGKTFFVRQSEMIVNACNPQSSMEEDLRNTILTKLGLLDNKQDFENCMIAVYYDAWINDNDTEPIFSLIYEITKQICVDFSVSENNIARSAASILSIISGYNFGEILKILESENPYEVFQSQKNIETDIQSFLVDLLSERGNRLIVFIDELDRCKPSFAVHLLEQLKHYISDERITFVFSVNLEQLQHTIKHYYGEGFDSCRYLDRFFDFRISIPSASKDGFYDDLGIYSQHHIESIIKNIVNLFNFELREISKFYCQVKVSVLKPMINPSLIGTQTATGRGRYFILMYIVPLLIGLKIANITEYDNFISGKDSKPLVDLIMMDETLTLLESFLNSNECLEVQSGGTLIDTNTLINRVYDAIFINQYTNGYSVKVGKYEFHKDSKVFAIDTASMMSTFVDYT